MKALLRLLIIYVLILSTTVSGETNPETLTPHQTVQVLLQGNDSGKLRQALLDLGGKITHDLPIVRCIGGVVGATELAKLAAMEGVEQLTEDFNPPKLPVFFFKQKTAYEI